MKIVDDITTIFSHQVRSFWHVIQDMICLVVCILASSASFPYHERANNLFMFFTALTCIIFFYKLFRTDLYTKSVRRLGAWGAKYRCFYAIYYSIIAFLCASGGGFLGYSFALIWIISGGTFLVVADKISKEENAKLEEFAQTVGDVRVAMERGCPYCKKNDAKETKRKREMQNLRLSYTCNKCKKSWTDVFQYVDVELDRTDLENSVEHNLAKGVF